MAPQTHPSTHPASRRSPSPTARLLGSLLPAGWPARAAIVASAGQLDAAHDGDATGLLLRAWAVWRGLGRPPRDALLRDLVTALDQLLGGVASEMKARHLRRVEVA